MARTSKVDLKEELQRLRGEYTFYFDGFAQWQNKKHVLRELSAKSDYQDAMMEALVETFVEVISETPTIGKQFLVLLQKNLDEKKGQLEDRTGMIATPTGLKRKI